MCGITGIIGETDPRVIDIMTSEMKHRGPDYSSTEQIGTTYLGHVRLSIIDISENSNQPLWDFANKACIVFNGEIYNYKELRQSLLSDGVIFNSEGDAEVLLNLYLKYGVRCLEKLSGIFSFAIWSTVNNDLFLARDNFGVKPLYYHQQDDIFCFASEIKSLLHVPSVKKDLNLDTLYRSLIFLWNPGDETLIKGIKKVKPGHYMIVKDGFIQEYKEYWNWPSYSPDANIIENHHSDNVLFAMRQSVKEQLVSDVKVGAFLSGGLDSSLIVALANEELVGNIDTFTIDSGSKAQSQEGFSDDLSYAKRVSQFLNVDLDILKVNPDIVNLLPKMIYHLDELHGDPAPLNVMLICEQAKRKGIKVLLSGAGGDDIFTGYRRHFAVFSERYWSWLPSSCRVFLKKFTSIFPTKNPMLRRLSKAFKYADLDGDERLLSYFYWIEPKIVRSLFKDPGCISDNPLQFILEELKSTDVEDQVERLLLLEQKYFMVDHNFNYTDKMSMATGVEVRVPFLDKGVVSTAAKIPSRLKQKGKVGKSILKKAAESVLPKDVIYRSKSGFGAPLRSWLKSDLSSMIDVNLSTEKIEKRGVFNPDVVKKLIEDDRSGIEDYSYPIFALLCFEIWCQQFIDK